MLLSLWRYADPASAAAAAKFATDPDGKDADTDSVLQTKPGQKYYQLTHDYLVHSLRAWLTRMLPLSVSLEASRPTALRSRPSRRA